MMDGEEKPRWKNEIEMVSNREKAQDEENLIKTFFLRLARDSWRLHFANYIFTDSLQLPSIADTFSLSHLIRLSPWQHENLRKRSTLTHIMLLDVSDSKRTPEMFEAS